MSNITIIFDEDKQLFMLENRNCSYIIGLADGMYPGNVFFGKKVPVKIIKDQDIEAALRVNEPPYTPKSNPGEKISFFDLYPMEFPCGGTGDFRESAIELRSSGGFTGCEFQYVSHRIYNGKPKLSGLPATFGDESKCITLELSLSDKVLGAELLLLYSIFDDSDVVVRSARLTNRGNEPFYIEKMYSASVDIDGYDYEMVTLHGSWAREREIERVKIRHGKQSVSSVRGISSHQAQPFMALVKPETTQTQGDVYAMHFVYSGNFIAQAELNQFNQVRMSMGIEQHNFRWKLECGESFQTPEAVLLYTDKGLGEMTRILHDLYRNHLIRSFYLDLPRPVLINNWEATYFDFDENKILSIAKTAKECGVDMFVMDDGWFGHRNAPDSSLGDWTVNMEKLPNGLASLVDKVNAIGMKFGLWFEPEMISPDSDLYRKHPDYVLKVPGREAACGRNQYVLDLSRQEVIDCVFGQISSVLESANIEYVKWDMNRPLSDLGSAMIENDRGGELSHRYMLGVYQLQERLLQRFPKLLLENCSSGGGRFDPGMLFYSPQIWCSDDTDALERLTIQEGTAMLYPMSAIGSHVSSCPNHIVGRETPWDMRGDVALAGTFGYELDVTKLNENELRIVSRQINTYRKYCELIQKGDYYRIASYSVNLLYDCWQIVSKDKKESLVVYVQVKAVPNSHSRCIRLSGLKEENKYNVYTEIEESCVNKDNDKQIYMPSGVYSGAQLMYMGIYLPSMSGDGRTIRIHLKA